MFVIIVTGRESITRMGNCFPFRFFFAVFLLLFASLGFRCVLLFALLLCAYVTVSISRCVRNIFFPACNWCVRKSPGSSNAIIFVTRWTFYCISQSFEFRPGIVCQCNALKRIQSIRLLYKNTPLTHTHTKTPYKLQFALEREWNLSLIKKK